MELVFFFRILIIGCRDATPLVSGYFCVVLMKDESAGRVVACSFFCFSSSLCIQVLGNDIRHLVNTFVGQSGGVWFLGIRAVGIAHVFLVCLL